MFGKTETSYSLIKDGPHEIWAIMIFVLRSHLLTILPAFVLELQH